MLLLLLDSDVIIDLHKFEVWDQITKRHKIHIPSIILHKEVYYYRDQDDKKCPIDLEGQIGGSIHEISCKASELLEFSKQFDSVLQQEIHDGEKEALHLIQNNQEFLLCTCDRAAIITLALLDLSDRAISFEKLMRKSGINVNLEHKHTEEYFKHFLKKGSIMKIQGTGLRRKKTKR